MCRAQVDVYVLGGEIIYDAAFRDQWEKDGFSSLYATISGRFNSN